MKTLRFVLILIMTLVCISGAAATTVSYKAVLNDIYNSFSMAIENKPVAFISMDSDSNNFSNRFINDVESYLINGGCIVIERRNIDIVLSELKFQSSGLVNDKSAVSIGSMVGAKMIITGSAWNMVSHYHVELKLIEVETGIIRRQKTYDIKYDSTMKDLISGKTSDLGSKKFFVTPRAGLAIEFNRLHEDFIGSDDFRPEGESNGLTYVLSALIGYEFINNLKLCADADFFFNNGMKVSDKDDGLIKFTYNTVDISAVLDYTCFERPIKLDIYAGGYISLPLSEITYEYNGISTSTKLEGKVFGATIGMNITKSTDFGALITDLRFFHDFGTLTTLGNGIIFRQGILATVGYSFDL